MSAPAIAGHRVSIPVPVPVAATKRPAVLCVDDEIPVLNGIERVLRSRFTVTKVTNGADTMAALQYGGPFAVIVCDFRLAETDGVQLLKKVREVSPDTVRFLLTGQAAMDDAIDAINDGQIFGFARKPCRPELLLQRVSDAAEQHRLLVSERELLEQTLHGSIKTLTELLAVACPAASGRATRLTRYASDLAAVLHVESWEIPVAAMLSQIGCVTLSNSLAERIGRGDVLTVDEQTVADRLPLIAEALLASIPRLDGVRAILRHQADRYDQSASPGAPNTPIGARILRVATDFDSLECRGIPAERAVAYLCATPGIYDPRVLDVLGVASSFSGRGLETTEITLSEVRLGMVFVGDVLSPGGLLLITRGQNVTETMLERIRGHWAPFAQRQRVRVAVAIS